MTDVQPAGEIAASPLKRLDTGGSNRDWVKPPVGTVPSLRNIAVHFDGSIRYQVAASAGESRHVAIALCEGYWSVAGKYIQVLKVEGAAPKTVDTVADIGKNIPAAFWFASGSSLMIMRPSPAR